MSVVVQAAPCRGQTQHRDLVRGGIEVGSTASKRARSEETCTHSTAEIVAICHEQHLVVGAGTGSNTELREGAGGEVVVTATDHDLHVAAPEFMNVASAVTLL
jgi:hypothetical protein